MKEERGEMKEYRVQSTEYRVQRIENRRVTKVTSHKSHIYTRPCDYVTCDFLPVKRRF